MYKGTGNCSERKEMKKKKMWKEIKIDDGLIIEMNLIGVEINKVRSETE
jgi:hypothetical protein